MVTTGNHSFPNPILALKTASTCRQRQFYWLESPVFGLTGQPHKDFGEGHAEQGFRYRQNGVASIVRERKLVIDDKQRRPSRYIFAQSAGLTMAKPING